MMYSKNIDYSSLSKKEEEEKEKKKKKGGGVPCPYMVIIAATLGRVVASSVETTKP